MTYKYDCRLFTGYKPCQYKRPNCEGCETYDPILSRILVISLEAMGAVIRSTCLLPAIKRKYPDSHITWVTGPRSKPLLENNHLIDRILPYKTEASAVLQALEFDVVFAVDKSMEAGALAEIIKAKEKFGFGVFPTGVIRPFTKDANYQYQVGLDDELKFFNNEKPETQQTTESMALEWQRDPYVLDLTDKEKQTVSEFRKQVKGSAKGIIGFNTGCSNLFPYKKLTVENSIKLIKRWRQELPDFAIALLGGPEDEQRQEEMKAAFANDDRVVNTPCNAGLRTGILWVDIADFVFSGDTLGMHIAIALGKPMITWFGLSCAQEIDLYDKGYKIVADVSCTPCWKKSCDQSIKCYNQVSLDKVLEYSKTLAKDVL